MRENNQVAVYRIEGLSCTSCAKKFEDNVKRISTVTTAEINFGAAKLTVFGIVTIEELEKAGAFDHLQLVSEHEKLVMTPFWQKRHYQQLMVSTFFLLGGFLFDIFYEGPNQLAIILYVCAALIGGISLFRQGIGNLIRLRFDMTTLMTVAILGAFVIGEWSEGAIIVILFAIGEVLERFSLDRARQSIRSLVDISPKEALVRRSGKELTIPAEEIQIGEVLLVKAGQQIAMDGTVVNGFSTVNQAPITGESIPVSKVKGDEIYAGTLNEEGYLEVVVTKQVQDTTLAKIIHLVEEAQAKRSSAQTFVDQFAKYYTPAILLLGLLIAIVPSLLGGEWYEWIYRGLSILVVGCPCALVISTPVAIVTAIGNAAKNGVLIKGGIYLEELGTIQAIAFDKTGTLTVGKPIVTDFIPLTEQKSEHAIAIAAVLEQGSKHPLASAVITYASERGVLLQEKVTQFISITGKGVAGEIAGVRYSLGNPDLFEDMLTTKIKSIITPLQQTGKTIMLLGTEQQLLAIIAVADQLRETSKDMITSLSLLGIERIVMLTGDNKETATAIAEQIGISDVQAKLLPDEKRVFIQNVLNLGNKVAMVGDGVNDAPALATSSVGIAMGGAGSDTALETADIVLMGDDLQKIPFAVRLSKATRRVIGQNIFLALALKIIALLLIIPGMLTLWLAVIADMGATLLVTLNALLFLKVK
jgi:Zn2+/Cd2+-exporting ATPase